MLTWPINQLPNRIGICLLMLFLVCSTSQTAKGQLFRKFGSNPFKKASQPNPTKFNSLPSQQELLASLQARSAAIKQLKARVNLDLPGAPKIKGTFQVEFPNRLRMKAGVIGDDALDVGSNDQDFWIWSKINLPGQPPTFFHANHLAFERSPIRQAIPLEPKWLIEALGLITYAPTDVHYGPDAAPNGMMKLFTIHQTPLGEHTRVTLLSMKTGLIMQQAIYGPAPKGGKRPRIAYSNSLDYKYYPEFQTSLPQTIELFVTQPEAEDLKIRVVLGNYSINSLNGDPALMWGMPNPGNDKRINLTQVSNATLQQQTRGIRQPQQGGYPQGARGFR